MSSAHRVISLKSQKKRTRRRKQDSTNQSPTRRLDQSELDSELTSTRRDEETESEELVRQLQTDFDDLLSKYAMAEVTIDQLRLGAKLNYYSDPALPSQATINQPGTARSATTLNIPHKGQASLNSSLQSATLGYMMPPGSSPRQAEAGILAMASPKTPLTEAQKGLTDNIIHLQDQVASFIAGVSGEGRVLNLKPEIHHQLYEALEQSQDTLHHQLAEEKQQDPSFDADNHLAGQLHQIRMSMDDHIDKLPKLQQPHRPTPPVAAWNSDDDGTVSHTPSSLHSGSTSIQRPKKSSERHSKRNSRKSTPQGSRGTPSYVDHSSSAGDELNTDDETVRPKSHRNKGGAGDDRLKPSNKGAASSSSVAGSDHIPAPLKSRTRIQGSSDSGFIGSEEGKSPNTPSDRHLSGLPTIQSQAETSGIDSSRALTPDLSESRTAEWALKHKIEVDSSEPVLPEPKTKRSHSRSSRKSTRSERSGQSSLKSEALRSIKSEIEKLRDDFTARSVSPERQQEMSPPHRHGYGSPMRATYKLPSDYQSPTATRAKTINNRPADVRNSDLDLSEVEGGRGYTPAPPQNNRHSGRRSDYQSTDEDPRNPPRHSKLNTQPSLRDPYTDYPDSGRSPHRHRDVPVKPEYLDESKHRHPDSHRHKYDDYGDGSFIKSPVYERRDEIPATSRTYQPKDSARHPSDQRDYTREQGSPSGRYYDYRDTPSRTSSMNDYNRPMYESSPHRHHQRSHSEDRRQSERSRRQERPSSVRSGRSYEDRDYRSHRSRPANRDEMSPIYESQGHDDRRPYNTPHRQERPSQYDDRTGQRPVTRTMDSLNMRDLNQTTIPYDSTVYTNQTKSPNIPPPHAVSTPYHGQNHTNQSHQTPPQYYQPQVPTQQPTHQSNVPLQTFSQSQMPYQQPQHQFQQSIPTQQQPPMYQSQQVPVQQTMTSLPVQQMMTSLPVQQPNYQVAPPQTVLTSTPATVMMQPVQPVIQGVRTTYQACPSCSGRGMLATAHNCALCGTTVKSTPELQLSNQLSSLQLATPTSIRVANQNETVIIPVANDKQGQAYLTQQTADGYVTQSVNVVENSVPSTTVIRSHSPATVAVPLIETSPSGKVRYYVREFGATSSDAEPSMSKSYSRRRRSRSRDRHTAESMSDLETSLREARQSAESLKRISRGMREGLREELLRSTNRRSLTSSWNL